MAFYDNPELGASRRVLGNSQFAYNDNPRVIPRLRSEQESTVHTDYSDDFVMPRDQIGVSSNSQHKSTATNRYISIFQQCWLLLFFRLPALYHSRMLQIGVNSGIGTVDLHLMSSTFSALWRHGIPSHPLDSPKDVVAISPHLTQFKASWEVLVDDLLQEWKMFNIISALVQTSVPVLLSLDAQVGSDPITKTGVLLSFICAGISLLCGSFCVLQFGSMRKMPKAAEWIREAHKSNQLVWWNCWIMLAMPATWLAWSVFLLFASIMSYTWRNTASQNDSTGIEISARTLLSLRITATAVLAFGIVCVAALAITLSLRFGDSLEQKFVFRTFNDRRYEREQQKRRSDIPFSHSHSKLPPASISARQPFPTTKLMDTNSTLPLAPQLPLYVQYQAQNFSPWNSFTTELQRAFQHPSSPSAEDDAFACIKRWNHQVFEPNAMKAILCMEFPLESAESDEGIYSVYVMDLAQASAERMQRLADIFGPLPTPLREVSLIDAMSPSVSRERGYPLGLSLEREAVPTHHQRRKLTQPAAESENSPAVVVPPQSRTGPD